MFDVTLVRIVGPTKLPLGYFSTTIQRPSRTQFAPYKICQMHTFSMMYIWQNANTTCLIPESTNRQILSFASGEITGPKSAPGS